MSKRLQRLRAVLMIMIVISMTAGQTDRVCAANSGSTVMVSAGEAAAENAVTPQQALEKESDAEVRIINAEEQALSDETSISGQTDSIGHDEDKPVWETIEIDNEQDLLMLAKNCTTDTWSEYKYVRLNNDINVFESRFETIPIFNGVFDGQGHQITEYSYSGDGYVTGFFRYIGSDGIVQNLQLYSNINAEKEKQVTGGICGINYGVIKNCDYFGSINGKNSTGGIAAINEVTGLISGCRNHGKLTGYYYTGGAAGKNYGTISDTINDGNLNDSEEWVNREDELNGGSKIIKKITGEEDDENLLTNTGIDTGGIAGYSKGSIIRCRNKGSVGYEHTGYNVGGIAGRQAGIISMCTNEGTILGRKDIGGITGQMEPHLEPEDVQSLSEAVDKLHDLIKITIDDADTSVDVIKDDVNRLSDYADGAVDTTDAMSNQFNNFMNSNLDTLNTFMTRMRYVMNHIPAVLEDLEGSAGYMADFNKDLKNIMEDIDIYGQLSANEAASFNEAMRKISENKAKYDDAISRIKESTEALKQAVSDNDKEKISENAAKLAEATEDANAAAAEIIRQLDIIYKIVEPHIGEARESLKKDIEKANSDMNKTLEKIKSASRNTRSIFDYINSQEDLRVTKLGGDWDNNKNTLHSQLNGVVDAVNSLSEHSSQTSHQTNTNLSEVNDQLNRVFHIIADDIDGIGSPKKSIDEIYTDVSDFVIEQIRSGRVDSSVNSGEINGDINIGGIAGSMDIDENDPESNAAGNVGFKLGERYLLRNVICDCRSTGDVVSKKDGAGAIVGYMGQGIVTACEGRGYVKSTEGGYVGGIAGQSLSIIRNCDVLAVISGSGYVGGVTGLGTTITGCLAIPVFEETGDRTGSIAGQVERDKETQEAKMGVISSNYFVNDHINGIDSINYTDIAEPVQYGILLNYKDLPSDFRHLTISYRLKDTDGSITEIGTQEVPYGTPITSLSYPEFEEKDGYYVEWDDTSGQKMEGNRIVNGEYVEIVTVIESKEKYPDTERPIAIMDGSFERESAIKARLVDETEFGKEGIGDGNSVIYEVTVTGLGQANRGDYKVRLYNPFDEADLYYYDREKEKFVKCRDVLERIKYLETGTEYIQAVYAIVEREDVNPLYIVSAVAGAILLIILLRIIIKLIKIGRRP